MNPLSYMHSTIVGKIVSIIPVICTESRKNFCGHARIVLDNTPELYWATYQDDVIYMAAVAKSYKDLEFGEII
jgi:hypothetical protein